MAATTSRWTVVQLTLSVGLCLALLVRTGLGHRGHGLDFLPPSALRGQKFFGAEECISAVMTLTDCATELEPDLPGKKRKRPPSKADPPPKEDPEERREGVLGQPHELFFGAVVKGAALLKDTLGLLSKTTSVSSSCCHSVNEISEKCSALSMVLKLSPGYETIAAFCKPFVD